ncbi:MAG: ExbD/TolR family protein [Steroidobacteraceae bacterium]
MNIGSRNKRDDDLEINVTSFIDVLLLLLIFFMLATSFVTEGRINIRLPDASAQADSKAPQSVLEIGVSATGNYRVNGQDLLNNSVATLEAAINKAAGQSREQTVLIRADANSSHQSVVTAMDVVGRVGFKAISIATVHQADNTVSPASN